MSVRPRIHQLQSGVRLIEVQDRNRHTAYMYFGYGLGATHETSQQNGIFHFLEHLAFKGTKNRTPLGLKKELSSLGATYNAYTTRENTAYFVNSLAEDVPDCLTVLSDIAVNAHPPQCEIDTERGAILQEIKQEQDDPARIVNNTLYGTAYEKQPLGQTVLGPYDNIAEAISYDDLISARQAKYTKSNLIVAVAGNFDLSAARDVLERSLAHLPLGEKQETPDQTYTGGERVIQKETEQVNFRLSFEAPSDRSDLKPAAKLLSSVIGEDMSSRLFQEVREKRGLVYSVWSDFISFEQTGLFTAGGSADSENIQETMNVLSDELRKAAGSLTQEELDIAKRVSKVSLLRQSEDLFHQAVVAEDDLRIYDRISVPADRIRAEEAVTLDQLNELANMIFSGKPTYVAVGPVANSGIPTYDQICNKLRF